MLQRRSEGSLYDGPREERWAAGIPWEPRGPAEGPEVRRMGSRVSPSQHCQQSGPHHPLHLLLPAENILGASTVGPGNRWSASEQGAEAALHGPLTKVLGSGGKGPKTLGIV